MNLTDTPISSTRPHARLSPQSPSGFSGLSEESNGVAFSDEKVNNTTDHTNANESVGRERAVQMLRDRGVDGAETLTLAFPQVNFVRTCEWYDRKPSPKTPGMLVWKIREGGVSEEEARPRKKPAKNAWMREAFDRFLQKHPIGSRLCTHRALAARRWPNDREDCPGSLIVDDVTAYPTLVMLCDQCGFEAGIGPRDMRGDA